MIRNETFRMITDTKENFFSTLGTKLSYPAFGLKTYWTTLNRIINQKRRQICNHHVENINIDADKVLKIIRSLDCKKARGWDNLSISMVKICDSGIVEPLCLIC